VESIQVMSNAEAPKSQYSEYGSDTAEVSKKAR